MFRAIFDLETDGFLDECTKVHSLVIKDADTGEVHSFSDARGDNLRSIRAGLLFLAMADVLIAHNGIKFDIPVLKKLFNWKPKPGAQVIDTLVMCRLIFTRVGTSDFRLMSAGTFPKDLIGRHSLEAWGWRLGEHKGDFNGPWDVWTPEMQTYCEQDAEVTYKLFRKIEDINYSPTAIALEHDVAWICAQIERNGFCVNVRELELLFVQLKEEFVKVKEEIQSVFLPTVVKLKTKTKHVPFNPGSRQQIAKRLKEKYGWVPQAFTDNGQAKIDDEILEALEYPEAKLLARYFMLEKRIGQIGQSKKGEKAWLQVVRNGKIHGGINPNGARTGRATHSHPNIAQVPKAPKPYGQECRQLFIVPKGWKLLGSDTGQLELRCLAHYMAALDGGEYTQLVNAGDVHTANQQAAGLPTRENAKTFIYGFIYGAGDPKLGEIVGKGKAAGAKLRKSFLTKIPALGKLAKGVKEKLKAKKHLIGLDGRRLYCESEHAALNTLLQSAGGLICKYWMKRVVERLEAQGLTHGWDGEFAICAWVHDELQIAVRCGYEDVVAKACVDAIKDAELFFKLRCPLTAAYKIGDNWHDTH